MIEHVIEYTVDESVCDGLIKLYDTVEASLAGLSNTSSSTNEQQDQQQDQQQNQQQEQEQDQQQDQQQSDTTPPAAPTNVNVTTAATDNTPTITGQAEGNSTVKIFNGSTQIGTATASSSGSFTITVSNPLANGAYNFIINATDAAGNVSNNSTISHTINVPTGGGNGGGGGGGYGS